MDLHVLETGACVFIPQDYVYPDVKDRQFLRYFYKGANKSKFSVSKYNELRDELSQVGGFFFLHLDSCITTSRRHPGDVLLIRNSGFLFLLFLKRFRVYLF